jgi:hypothetical protein
MGRSVVSTKFVLCGHLCRERTVKCSEAPRFLAANRYPHFMKLDINDYKILETGVDGGHRYIKTNIEYHGQTKSLVIFFQNKLDGNPIKVTGDLKFDEQNNSLTLNNSRLL